MHALSPPPDVTGCANATCLLSAWVARGNLHATVNFALGDTSPDHLQSLWGLVFSDAVHHLADALHAEASPPKRFIISEILDSYRQTLKTSAILDSGSCTPVRTATGPLEPPPPVAGDDNATELVQVWLADDEIHVCLLLGSLGTADGAAEEQAWGRLLGDLTLLVAAGVAEHTGLAFKETATRIISDLADTLSRPPEEGRFYGR